MESPPEKVSENAYQRIRKLLFDGELKPGQQLVERELALQLGVSRVPVREALRKLVCEGMLTGGDDRSGVRVRNYSPGDVQELIEYRQLLEAGIVRHAAMRITDRELVGLRKICDQSERVIGSYGSKRWAKLDHQFHISLAETARNERLYRALDHLLTEAHFLFYLAPATQRKNVLSKEEIREHMAMVVMEHRRLLDLIQRGEADEAARLAHYHAGTTRWILEPAEAGNAAG